ncbi:malto-oligosyltrehalose synthase [Salinicola aestuarinus]|uniref:malto-oligosyltrehalose synthase n=1 Tax=Salinicola aestuarinus TaxID=1949082 RepID=UPI000DA1A590|nr:malto-oligosyltrehalose synthase [Salinicola aestuarinus]
MRPIRATVRLQLHKDFDFEQARQQVDYYAALGVSHYYLSPILRSRRGSPHGYDGVDPTRVDPELGGEAGFRALVDTLHAHDMGVIADIVPNHLAVSAENPWWQDLLANGREGEFAHCFDVDWHQPGADGKLLLPFLGDRYQAILDGGELTLVHDREHQRFAIAYHDNRFPIGERHTQSILDHGDGRDPDAALAYYDVATAAGRERLHALLEQQAYRLAHWRMGNDALNWRRFFDITELAGIRVEDESVFDLSHACILSLVEQDLIDGLRIDHVDGLADPKGYCLRLRQRLDAIAERSGREQRIPIYVEKILAGHETLHTDWGVDGTSGYEFLDVVSGLQHDPAGEAPLKQLWRDVSGRSGDFAAEVRAARREMLEGPLTAEFERCVLSLRALAVRDVSTRELSEPTVRRVLKALAVAYPVYRSYADGDGRPPQDVADFATARERAASTLSKPDAAWLDRFDAWLGGEAPSAGAGDEAALRLEAIARFQQLTSPLAAKAVEDTAGYRSATLISRNDVGCEGETFAYPPQRFHAQSETRNAAFPLGMITTATHDHKRGEDVRARLAAISELTPTLVPCLDAWASDKRLYDSPERPSGGDRLMLLQVMLAAWPIGLAADDRDGLANYADRLVAWQQKAMREAKLDSHWLAPDADYEQAGEDAVRRLLCGDDVTRDLAAAAGWLDLPGAINALSQVTLRLCAPGVPDLYQGTEFWDQTLVDPDNRRPVNMAARRDALDALSAKEAWRHWKDGGVKQRVVKRLLALRQALPSLFAEGDYRPLSAQGEQADHLIAFARTTPTATLIVAVPRLSSALTGNADATLEWGDTRLSLEGLSLRAEGVEQLTGERVSSDDALPLNRWMREFPCAVWVWRP